MIRPIYSIIIAHKNTPKLLFRLLNSIPAGSDFEVIVADDHSNPETINKLKAHTYEENVQLCYLPTAGGAGRARNEALALATGKWILFADADDFFTYKMRSALEQYQQSAADVVYFDTGSVDSDNLQPANRHERYSKLVTDFIKDASKENELRYYFTPPWGKMIRAELIKENNIRFEEIIASNDILFSIQVAHHASTILADPAVLYIITVSRGSLINTLNKHHFTTRFHAAIRANNYLRKIGRSRYQLSVLYYISKCHKFGLKTFVNTLYTLTKNRSNLLIGFEKIFSIQKTLRARENTPYLVKQTK